MIKVEECGEPLVDIIKVCPKVVLQLDKSRIKIEKKVYIRKTVAEMLNKAISFLPAGLTFIIIDAWRPEYIQEKIFQRYIKIFKKKYPPWSEKAIIKEAKKYVHPSKGKYVSGHMTGGALDLRLVKNGRRLPMKSSQLTFQENAQSIQPKLPIYIQKNRRIMFKALEKVGFSNYPKEYWHWSYGDIRWAQREKIKKAIYDIVTI